MRRREPCKDLGQEISKYRKQGPEITESSVFQEQKGQCGRATGKQARDELGDKVDTRLNRTLLVIIRSSDFIFFAIKIIWRVLQR